MTTQNRARYSSKVDTDLDVSVLREPVILPFSGLVAQNRFLKSAMTEWLSSFHPTDLSKRGMPSEQMVELYRRFGEGRWGILATGNVIVNAVDLEAPGNAVLYKPFETPERLRAFARYAEAAKAKGSVVVMQLSHAGRQVVEDINPHPVSASDVQLPARFGRNFAKPTPLTKEGIDEVVEQFTYAAEMAHKTGFNGIQLHGAHGYLLAQFLAPSTNKRTDEYGGSLANRARIIYRIISSIKERVPDPKFSVSIKINSREFQEGGFTTEECRDVCVELERLGVDFVELSGGTYEAHGFQRDDDRESTKKREAFFIEFASLIRPHLKRTKIFVTGGWRTSAAMVSAIESGSTDGIGFARSAGEEPSLPLLLSHPDTSRRVPSVVKNHSTVDERDYMLTNILAGTQLRQSAFGLETLDSSSPEGAKAFFEALGKFEESMKSGNPMLGYPRVDTGDSEPTFAT